MKLRSSNILTKIRQSKYAYDKDILRACCILSFNNDPTQKQDLTAVFEMGKRNFELLIQ